MAHKTNSIERFWHEMKRRNVIHVIAVYAAVAFAVLQLSQILSDELSFPDWTMNLIIIILAVGFPITAIFSWFFDITSSGIEKTKPLNDKKKRGTESEIRTWKSTTLISIIIIFALIVFNIVKGSIGLNELKRLEKTIAVLPFENMSNSKEDDYMGDAITDEIIMQLYKIEEFTVRSKTSVMQYKKTNKSSLVVGKELDINFLVEGSIQLSEEKFRIRVQLINANKDDHLWGDIYEGNRQDIFFVQSKIAKQIADALKTVLTPEEIKKIDKSPTTNPDAYSRYLSGKKISDEAWYFFIRGNMYTDSSSFDDAISNYDKSIEYDPSFATAYSKRAITRSLLYYIKRLGGSKEQENIIKCKEDIEKALAIDPELLEAQMALGFYYYFCKQNYSEALIHFKIASDRDPENWEPLFYMAMVHRRYGNWTMSRSLMTKVLKYNPQDALILTNIGLSYDYLKDYDTALIYHDKAIKVMPNWESPYINKIETLVRKNGSTDEARKLIDTAINNTGRSFIKMKIMFDIYDGKYESALYNTERILNTTKLSDYTFPNNYGEKLILCANINNLLDRPEAAREYFGKALVILRSDLLTNPDDPEIYSNTGIAYAGLMKRLKAVESGERALKLTENNALYMSHRRRDLAQIYVMVGDYERSLKQIEELLKNPSCFSLELMKLDPIWKPLIYLPQFQNILVKYSKK